MDINAMLSNLLGGLTNSTTATAAEQVNAAKTRTDMTAAAGSMETMAQEAIAKNAIARAQAAEIERRKNAQGERAQAIAGLDPADLNNEYVRTMAQLTVTRDQKAAAMQQYRQLTETSFMDNPVGYIFNQLELPKVVQTHNNLVTQQSALEADLQARTALLAQNKSAVTANVADAIKEQNLTAAIAADLESRAKLEQTRMDNLSKIATTRMNELALQDRLVQNTATKYQAGMQMAQFQATQQERAEARAERAAARAERAERAADAASAKKEKDAQEQALGVGLARVSAALGYPRQVTVADFKMMPQSKSKQALYNAAVEGTFGDDLASSLSFVSSGNTAKMQKEDPAFMRGVSALNAAVSSYAAQEARKPENAKAKPEAIKKAGGDEYVLATVKAAHDPKAGTPLNDAKWDTVMNPGRPQDATMLRLIANGVKPELANNSYVKVLQTVAATLPPTAPDFKGEHQTAAVQALAELVRTRKIPLAKAAADLVAYTKSATDYNQESMKLASLGFPVQESAYIAVSGGMLGAGTIVGDTLNKSSAENLLVKLATSRAAGLERFGLFTGLQQLTEKELRASSK